MEFILKQDVVSFSSLLLIYYLTVIASVNTRICKAFQLKREHLDLRLKEHVIHETTTDHHNCARFCYYLAACKSFDYDRRTNVCKLNDADSTSVQTNEFETKGLSIFSDISEWPQEIAGTCGSRPCSSKQRCLPSYPPRCIDIKCGDVNSIDNGKIELFNSGDDLFSDEANVICNIGYTIENTVTKCFIEDLSSKASCVYTDISTIQCHIKGKWEEKTCERIDCGNPTTENGFATLVDSSNTTYMAKATVTCNEGYETNTLHITCQSDGIWSSGNCAKINCGALPIIANGVATLSQPGANQYLDTATLTCNYGFTPSTPTFKCMSTKSWEFSHCACMPIGSYKDTQSVTGQGYTCQRWDSQYPHSHGYTNPAVYPDGGISAAENYCRALGETYLWCYTTTPAKRWDYCERPTYIC